MSRPAPALHRLERILAMVPWLLEHPGARVGEITERFGLSREELARDLDILGYCGLPGYGGGDLIDASIVGERVVVRLADYFRRPVRLSVREAVTLLLAARALAGVESLPESSALRSAETKLTALLRSVVAPTGTGSDSDTPPRIAVDLAAPGDEHLPVLRDAVLSRRVVRLVYRSGSKAETTQRDVEPWSVTGSQGSWYLQGYCRVAQAPRDFRLDRIRELEVTDEVVGDDRRAVAPARPAYRPDDAHERVVLDLLPEAWWVAEAVVADESEQRGDVRRITVRTAQREWLVRLLLGLGDTVHVVEPEDLAGDVAALARRTLARYRPDGHE